VGGSFDVSTSATLTVDYVYVFTTGMGIARLWLLVAVLEWTKGKWAGYVMYMIK